MGESCFSYRHICLDEPQNNPRTECWKPPTELYLVNPRESPSEVSFQIEEFLARPPLAGFWEMVYDGLQESGP